MKLERVRRLFFAKICQETFHLLFLVVLGLFIWRADSSQCRYTTSLLMGGTRQRHARVLTTQASFKPAHLSSAISFNIHSIDTKGSIDIGSMLAHHCNFLYNFSPSYIFIFSSDIYRFQSEFLLAGNIGLFKWRHTKWKVSVLLSRILLPFFTLY